MHDLDEAVRVLGQRINAPADLLSLAHEPTHSGAPHVEYADGQFSYVITERGTEFSRKTTRSIGELLYWIFSDITFSMASDYEVRNREKGKDFRRLLFARQRTLLVTLDPAWGEQYDMEISHALLKHPFVDA